MAMENLVTIETLPDVVRVALTVPELDFGQTESVLAEALEAAAARRPLPVALDISAVETFPSLGLGMLVRLQGELRKSKQRLLIVGAQPFVRQSLAVTRLDKALELYDTLEDARQQLQVSASLTGAD